MTKHINADKFRQDLVDRQITTQFFNPAERHEIGCIIEMLDNTPAADVSEIKHGYWIERKEIFSEIEGEVAAIGCSECGKSQRKYRRTNFCPECGIKMDGERKE